MKKIKLFVNYTKCRLLKEGYTEEEGLNIIIGFLICNKLNSYPLNTHSGIKIVEEEFLNQNLTLEKILSKDSFLSWVYQYYYSESEKQIKNAIFYSPDWIVEYIVSQSLDFFLKYNTNVELKNIKILDPACGTGNFLLGVVDYLYKKYVLMGKYSKEEIITIILKQIWGCDIDKNALNICKINIEMKFKKLTGVEVDLNKIQIYNEDFLLSFNKKEFHIIVGNPPYLENRKINKYYNKENYKERFQSAKGRFDLFSLFIEKALNINKYGGLIGYIIPSSLMYNNNFEEIRKLILAKGHILEIIYLGEGVFGDIGMPMMIVIIQNRKRIKREHHLIALDISESTYKKKALYKEKGRLICQNYYYNTLKNVFDIQSCQTTFALREKLNNKYSPLKDYCRVVAGVATGNIRNKLVLDKPIDEKCLKVLEGKNIEAYYKKWTGKYVNYNRNIIKSCKGEYATFMRQEFIENPKILIRQTAHEIIAAYDEERYCLLNTLYSLVVQNKNLEIKYVLAVLNSKLMSFLYHSLIQEKGRLFPQIKIFHIQNLPLAVPSKSVQNEICNTVDEIIHIKRSTKDEKKYRYEQYIELLNILDHKIYSIYELTEKEIDLIKGYNRKQ